MPTQQGASTGTQWEVAQAVSSHKHTCRQLWSRGLVDSELDALVAAFEGIARASYQKNVSIISLICNVQRTSHILERVSGLVGLHTAGGHALAMLWRPQCPVMTSCSTDHALRHSAVLTLHCYCRA